MGYYAVTTLPEKTDPLPKNRVGVFSASARVRARLIPSQPLEQHLEKRPIPTEIVSGVRYYGLRYYTPELGRWSNRDPIGELGFYLVWDKPNHSRLLNASNWDLYLFVQNNSLDEIDFLGLLANCGVKCGKGCKPVITGCDTWPKVIIPVCKWHEQQHIDKHPDFCKMGAKVTKYDNGVVIIGPDCCSHDEDDVLKPDTEADRWPEECPIYAGSIGKLADLLKGNLTEQEKIDVKNSIKGSCKVMNVHCENIPAICKDDEYK